MNNKRIMIVDDSPFQIAMLTEMLESNGFNVVGEAKNLEEVREKTKELKPDLVTMDMTMPGTDGFECTQEIHKIDSSIKVIVVSSMMDEELIKKAKKINISGYLQKPVDPEELTLLINRVISDETLYNELDELYPKVFRESLINLCNTLMNKVPKLEEVEDNSNEIVSEGISIVMGIIGRYSGRLIMDMSLQTASQLAKVLLRREAKNEEEILNVIAELSNMLAGNACSMINKKDKIFGLRVAPPTTFHGESINISKTEVSTNHSYRAEIEHGSVFINIGFERRGTQWMSII